MNQTITPPRDYAELAYAELRRAKHEYVREFADPHYRLAEEYLRSMLTAARAGELDQLVAKEYSN